MSTKRKAATTIAKPVVKPSAKAQIKSKIDETRTTVSTGLASRPGSKVVAEPLEVDGSEAASDNAEEEVSQDEEDVENKTISKKAAGTKRPRDDVDQDEVMQDGAEASDGEPTSPTFGDLVRGTTTVDVSASLAAQAAAARSSRNGTQHHAVAPITATSLGTVLNQALRTDDNDLLESCLQTSDTKIIEATINRMDSALASVLLSKLAARMHRRPGRAFGLMRWMQWTLVAHGGALVTQPDLVARLAELSRVLEERSRGLSSLLALKGKLDMLDSQLKFRKSIKSASAARGRGLDDEDESSEEEEEDADAPGVVYVEGQETVAGKALPNGTTGRDEDDDAIAATAAVISDSEDESDADFDEEDEDEAAEELADESLDEDEVDHDDVEEDDEEDEEESDGGVARGSFECDGKRPTCSACSGYNRACVYLSADPNESRTSAIKRKFGDLQERMTSHEELYHLLRTRTLPEVYEILRRIRAGIDVEDILRYVRDGDLLLQLHLAPETRLRYTFPDFASWPVVFRDPDDPYLRTPLLDFDVGDFANSGSEAGDSSSSTNESSPATTTAPARLRHAHTYQMPYHAAHTVDPRLSAVRAATWTSVTGDDALVARLLGIYFQFEYPRTRIFQKDLFLDDLAQGKTNFCSSLLVNCILANAAHGLTTDPHRVEFWTPRSLPYAFLAEAKRLWDIEVDREQPRLTTIHAAVILCLRYGSDGADSVGIKFLVKALEFALKMGLFTRKETCETRGSLARAFTAWSLYAYQGVTFYYLRRTPIVAEPPVTPLPDYDTVHNLTGEIYIQYPLQPTPTPITLPATFRAQVELNVMMMEIGNTFHSNPTPETATLDAALKYYEKLDAWFRALPPELQPKWVVMPHQLQVHMEYYLTLIELFEPWARGPDATTVAAFNGRTIADIATSARARMETLIRLYYLRHSFDALDAMLIMFLLLLGSITVHVLGDSDSSNSSHGETTTTTTTEEEEDNASGGGKKSPPSKASTSRNRDASTLLLCAKGLADQGNNLYLGTLMFNVLSKLVTEKVKTQQQPGGTATDASTPTPALGVAEDGGGGGGLPESLITDLERIRVEAGRVTETSSLKPQPTKMHLPVPLILLSLSHTLLAQPTPDPLDWLDLSLSRNIYRNISAVPPPSGSTGHFCLGALHLGGIAYPHARLTTNIRRIECRGGEDGTGRARLVFRGFWEGAGFMTIAARVSGRVELGAKAALGEVGVGVGYLTNHTSPTSPAVFDTGAEDLSSRYPGGYSGTFSAYPNIYIPGTNYQRGRTVCETDTTLPAIEVEFWIAAAQPNGTTAGGDPADYEVRVSDVRVELHALWDSCDLSYNTLAMPSFMFTRSKPAALAARGRPNARLTLEPAQGY
ncbi:hypothetical protein VTJ49DRAFT_5193 [Mycothermus thermophilus]|uniref:Transcription factor domain-containing protein n=1 Tax=Humicola insolens TaxID=85995 RepID=A0ABR3VLU4_HUMIN